MCNMSEHTHIQSGYLALQQHLTDECILNQNYAYEAHHSVSGVKNVIVPAILALSTLIQKTESISNTPNTPNEAKTKTLTSTDNEKDPPDAGIDPQ